MFSFEGRRSFLYEINPIIKITLVLIATILVCLSFYPVMPLSILLILFVVMAIWGKYGIWEQIKKVKTFLLVCLSFAIFLLFVRGLTGEGAYRVWIFRWDSEDFIFAFSLALRILCLACLSMFFVLTTDPADLVLSMMLQLKLSYVPCYATLAAYRFLPTFRNELEKIRLARAIRGQTLDETWLQRLKAPFCLAIPLLTTAVRRGEQVSIAMESRALGAYKDRTFLKRTAVTKKDICFLTASLLTLGLLTLTLIRFNLFNINAGFQL